METTIQGIAVRFEPKRLMDYRNMRTLYKLRDSGELDLGLFDKWGIDVFGSDEWDRMVDEFAEKHDGYIGLMEWVTFINEIISSAKEDEGAKNS